MKVILACGARPNFVKIAPLMRAIDKHNASSPGNAIQPVLVHTGQHYDYEMSQVFFQDLELPKPDIYLGVGSGTHAEQTGRVMIEFEQVLFAEKPDLVVVVGDVNSTLAAALAAVKLCIPVAHVEAGLRSHDRTMPEEINRLLTDAVSDYLFTPSPDADENLKKEGIPEEKISLVGNVMVDSLLYSKKKAQRSKILSLLRLREQNYALLTLHRPENVDRRGSIMQILEALEGISRRIPIAFPVHPRTKKNIQNFGLGELLEGKPIHLVEPLGYLDFLNLEMNAKLVLTDSGGVQEETTVLNVPCLTLRSTTERWITVTQGTNILVGNDAQKILGQALAILDGRRKEGVCPRLWDGRAGERIVGALSRSFS
jgi:UDP-N-acetylglucosamine 2-epimerase (non-hydrolysing)